MSHSLCLWHHIASQCSVGKNEKFILTFPSTTGMDPEDAKLIDVMEAINFHLSLPHPMKMWIRIFLRLRLVKKCITNIPLVLCFRIIKRYALKKKKWHISLVGTCYQLNITFKVLMYGWIDIFFKQSSSRPASSALESTIVLTGL